MKRILLFAFLSMGLVACGSDSSGGGGNPIVASGLQNAQRADLSGQASVFTGNLGSGVTFTFPAVKDQGYLISFQSSDSSDQVVLDFAGDDGTGLKSKTVDSGDTYQYTHIGKSQHVLVIARPRNPFNTAIDVTSLTITGRGSFPEDAVHVNFVVAGKHTGYGSFGDMATTADQAAFTTAVMQKVQQHFAQSGIAISFEGFAYTADQVKAQNPSLIGPDDMALCAAGETVGSSGFGLVQTQGLDAWGDLGFDKTDPDFDRSRGINLFIVHHFSNDGTVGLSPRPGVLIGRGPDTALCVATFLQQGSTLIPRTADEVALVATHEIGHFLGLLHTTTFTPDPLRPSEAIDDGVSDTPECLVTTDVNGDGRVGIGDGCPDETNIMFYQSGPMQTVFSQGQSQIMRNLLSLQEH
ncbi:MAG: hypothetical protein JKY65_02790 [Planctomycetes bacterium]|nr:hypothetical protein [Planctomycetota bacterium]